MRTYLKSTLNTQGILHVCRPVKRLGWQGRLSWVVVIEHDGSRSDAQVCSLANKAQGIGSAVNKGHWTFRIVGDSGGAAILPKPRGAESEGKDAHLHLRLSPEHKSRYVAMAQMMGLTLSEWCLEALERGYIEDEDKGAVESIKP